MKILYKIFIYFYLCLVMVTYSAKAENNSAGNTSNDVQPSGERAVQIVTACDGRKKMIVEGCNEGEPMPEHKARKNCRNSDETHEIL